MRAGRGLLCLLLPLAGVLAGCGTTERETVCYKTRTEPVIITERPPAPRREAIPEAPGPDYGWVPGHWERREERWKWRPGHWEIMPDRETRYAPGHWVEKDCGWVWAEGRWVRD